MERRIEPEPALRRKIGGHVDVGDQETIVKDLAFALEAEHAAYGASRPVGDDQPVSLHRVVAVGRGYAHGDAVGLRRDAYHLVLPAKLGLRQLANAFHQELLDPVLL